MPVYVNTFFEERLERLLSLADVVEKAFSSAGLEYRVIGGLATYLYVEDAEPDAGRLTKDIDIAVRHSDLERIAEAVKPFGLTHSHVAGEHVLSQSGKASTRRAVHLIFTELGPYRRIKNIRSIPLAELVRMKLTSYRIKDQMHLKDLDEVRLITDEIEGGLSETLRKRLASVRARE